VKLTKLDIITVSIAVLVPLGSYFGYFKHRLAKLSQINEAALDLELQTADDYKVATEMSVARSNVRKLQQHIDKFFDSVTGHDEAHKAVDSILQSAKAAGVDIKTVRPGTAIEGQTLNCLPISLTVSAKFAKLYDFLCRVERDKLVITVETMQLDSDPASDVCNVKLELRVYFSKSPTATETPA